VLIAIKSGGKIDLQSSGQKAIIGAMNGGEIEDRFAEARRHMVRYDLKGRGIADAEVLRIISEIRREEFVPEKYKSQAYADGPLPIGTGQTISQPYIVALMTEQLELDRQCEVLEIGTGSGYQTAVLAGLSKKVYTVERKPQLSSHAQAVLKKMGIDNVQFHIGDGSCGWPQQRLFDRIMVTAAVPRLPQPLINQLADGGLMIAPVGSRWVQELIVCEKRSGEIRQRGVCDVQFVKLYGEYAFRQ